MLLDIFMKGYAGLRFLSTLKMGHKKRKVENHWFKCKHAQSISERTFILCYAVVRTQILYS